MTICPRAASRRAVDLARAGAVRTTFDAALQEDAWCHLVVPAMHLEWSRMYADSPLVARRLRGRLMRTLEGFEAEVSAGLQFPEFYEDYPNAFEECLGDLDWLPTTEGYLLLVTHPEQLLTDEPPSERAPRLVRVVDALGGAAATFAGPLEDQGDDDRPPLAFDVVLIAADDMADEVRERWRFAGAPL